MMANCVICAANCAEAGMHRVKDGCVGYVEKQPQTNYDLLISKTPEELATFFGTLPCCPPGNADELCFPDNTCGVDTKMMIKCWANWLKGPVEVDNEPDP